MGRFEAELEKARHQLQLKLIGIDPLDEEQLEAVLGSFNQRLTELQRDFREHLIRPGDEQVPPIGQFALTAPSLDRDAELNAGIVVGGMAAILLFAVPVRISSLWPFEFVETPADVIGEVLNLHPGFVTVGAGFFAGSLAALATSLLLRPNRRELLREALILKFNRGVAPKLRAWASRHGAADATTCRLTMSEATPRKRWRDTVARALTGLSLVMQFGAVVPLAIAWWYAFRKGWVPEKWGEYVGNHGPWRHFAIGRAMFDLAVVLPVWACFPALLSGLFKRSWRGLAIGALAILVAFAIFASHYWLVD